MFWVATAIFVVAYAIIVSEKIHKTKVALLGAALTLITKVLSQHDALHDIDLGVDWNVIFLLISMMIIVNIMTKTGVFQYVAIKAAKVGKGNPFTIMSIFAVVTALASAFLDNVTTVLLLAPVTLLIANELEVDPIPFLITEALASNIGGTATLIGDPPNIMIGSAAGLTFNEFIVNMAPIMAVDLIVVLGMLALIYREDLHLSPGERAGIEKTFADLKEREAIRDRPLFGKSVAVILLVIGMFFFQTGSAWNPPSSP